MCLCISLFIRSLMLSALIDAFLHSFIHSSIQWFIDSCANRTLQWISPRLLSRDLQKAWYRPRGIPVDTAGDTYRNRLLWSWALKVHYENTNDCYCVAMVLPTSSGNIGKSRIWDMLVSQSHLCHSFPIPSKIHMTVKIYSKNGSFSKRESSQCTSLHISWS